MPCRFLNSVFAQKYLNIKQFNEHSTDKLNVHAFFKYGKKEVVIDVNFDLQIFKYSNFI